MNIAAEDRLFPTQVYDRCTVILASLDSSYGMWTEHALLKLACAQVRQNISVTITRPILDTIGLRAN